ncbi:MAG: thiamine pyrophosphate-binding protein [Myxococcota bacterium]
MAQAPILSPNFQPRPQRVVDVFLQYLSAERCKVVFGIPGGLLHPFFEAVEQSEDFELVVSKHEEGAAFMADGYARTSRQLAVCAGTSGPGATNMLTGVACAHADGVPMLIVTGQANSRALGKGAAQETQREDIDIVGMFQPVTKYSVMVTHAADLGHHVRRALRLALSGRPGPVHLNIPVEIWEQTADEAWFDPSTYRPPSHMFDRLAVQRAAEALMEAERPVLLAGSGIASAGAEEHLRTLAELLPARVATSPRGKGLFPEDHPLSLGVLGFAGHGPARQTILGPDCDVLMTTGASLNETTTFNWSPALRPSRALLQLDVDPDRIGRNYPVEVPLVGDAQTILTEITYHAHRLIRDGRRPNSRWGEISLVEPQAMNELARSAAVPVTPQRWRADLQAALPDDALIFSDIGGHMLFNIHELRIREGQRFVLNLGFGSMGHGTISPIGAALAHPGRPTVAIIGDGCFTMNGMDLLTAAEYGVRVVWIVENNNMHGITWHGSKMVGEGKAMEAVRYKKPVEVAGIARAMGLMAQIVDQPGQMQGALQEALAHRGPSLIEVRVDGRISPPLGDRAKTIAGFTK